MNTHEYKEKQKITLAAVEHALKLIDSDKFSASERAILIIDGQINTLKSRKRRLTKLIEYIGKRQPPTVKPNWAEL
jgi:hypothetical protein